MTDTPCRVARTHAITDAGGQPYGPGEELTLDLRVPYNRRLLERGDVVRRPEKRKLTGEALQERARELEIDGRSEMTADQLREAIADAESNPATEEE